MRKKNILILFCLILYIGVHAQSRYTTTNTKAINAYERSAIYLNQQLYNTAIKELQTSLKYDSTFLEAHHRLADIYKTQKEYTKAIHEYLKIVDANPNFTKQLNFLLGECYFSIGDYQKAKNLFEKYLDQDQLTQTKIEKTKKYLINCNFSIEAIKNPVPYKPTNLGPNVNTKFQEYLPTITADDNVLIFTRKTTGEDFFISTKNYEEWGLAIPLSNTVNTKGNEGAQCITPDGQYLFFAACNRPDGYGKCDIYSSKLTGNTWSVPENLGAPINTNYWESQPSISADGKTLYFVSDRKGGFGKNDIWKTTYLSNNKWSNPVNLGPNINTAEDEISPFIHPDNKTLYFSSDGWPGFGEKDIFFSRKTDSNNWSTPTNLGFPINTPQEESSLFVSNDGKKAYFASNNLGGFGELDLYTFELYEEARPEIVTFVKGVVSDKKTQAKLQAYFEIIDVQSGDVLIQSNTNDLTGQFLASLPVGKIYALNVNKEGYLFYSDNFSLVEKKNSEPFILNIPLQRIEVGNKITLKNIFFETGSFKIRNESRFELNKLISFLKTNPLVSVEIGGHTDNIGEDKINQLLSVNRAKAVFDYLVGAGIAPERLTYKGYGKNVPVDSNTTESGRANNRRTEIIILRN